MRAILLLSTIATLATLAACDDSRETTAPASRQSTPVPPTQASPGVVVPGAKPAPGSSLTLTTVTSTEFTVLAGGAVGGSVGCPDGTTRVSGGYGFTNEGASTATPTVTQSLPLTNGWFVRAVNRLPGSMDARFVVFAVCAS